MQVNNLTESDIKEIVREVLLRMERDKTHKTNLGIFNTVDKAVTAAKEAQQKLSKMPMEFREKIIQNIRKLTVENALTMAEMGVQETGMGCVGHKVLKHRLVAEKTPGTEDITTIAWSGDRGLTLTERGPFGVIGAVTPSTNPSETVICNTIGMIAGGNTVVFNPHPSARNTTNFAVELINRASLEAGGFENIAVSMDNPTAATGAEIFKHKDIPLLVATGGVAVVTMVLSCGKRGIGAGAGNPPVLVDETADIPKAAADIINGATFDNNLPCIAEKEIVAVSEIADELKFYLKENGAYEATQSEIESLIDLVFVEKAGKSILNRDCVGKSASYLLSKIGVDAPPDTRCIIFEGGREHPLIAEELMMPILGIVREPNVDSAIRTSVILESGNRHSAHMHSKNVDNLTKFGRAVDTAIFVKNGPSYSAIGYGGEGFCTFTIASRTGEGLTSARTFTKARRCIMSDSLCIR